MDDFQALLDTPFKLIGSLLLGLLLYYIKKDKEDLNARLDKIENKLSQVEDHIDAKIEFVVDKIMNITPEKESTNIKINQNSDKMIMLEKMIKHLSTTMEKIEESYSSDILNFKKILVKFRTELNELKEVNIDMEVKKNGT